VLKRLCQLAILFVAAFTMLGAGSPTTTFDRVGHNLMCTCGCNELLLECNHMGCPDSPRLIAELHSQVDAGKSPKVILASFASEYGPTVLAAPLRGGFDDVAWVMPYVVLALGILTVVLVLQHWKRRSARLAPAAGDVLSAPAANALRDRIRDETQYGE
jgi:cytochrome c-type biogenesis protein CcmH